MSDDEDELENRRRVLEIFRTNFQSDPVQKRHQAYINQLQERLRQWQAEIQTKLEQFIGNQIDELDQLYDRYCDDFNERYSDIKQQLEDDDDDDDDDTSTDINDEVANFEHFCQLNTIENCIQLHTKPFSDEQLNENIRLEYGQHSTELPERTNEFSETPIERTGSPDEKQTNGRLKSPIEERKIQRVQLTDEALHSSDEEKTIESPQSTTRKTPVERTLENGTSQDADSPIPARATESTDSLIGERSVELLESPVIEPPIRLTEPLIRKRLLQSPAEQKLIEPFQSPLEEEPAIKSIKSPVQKLNPSSTEQLRRIEPIKLIARNRSESISSAQTSSHGSSVSHSDHPRQFTHPNPSEIKRLSNASEQAALIHQVRPSSRRTSDDQSKGRTRLYVGQNNVLTAVLVGKDREVYNERERITEYSIDSIPLPREQQRAALSTESEDEMMIVRAYKVLIRVENEYQSLSNTSSDREIDDENDDDDDDEELSNIHPRFNLKKFDQINYSTIMFRKCETEYNCLASSIRRNELLLYNSKLRVLIVLQHEQNNQCRYRFYLHWPKTLSPTISDITYCQDIDYFLISTRDTSRIYLFDRHLLSIIDLGQLSNDAPLRRIHSFHRTIYCILANNYLLEYQFNDDYSQISILRKIKLFNPLDLSQDTAYHLLDVTADENYLIVLYGNEHDEIRLQSIYRQTRKFHQDILLDTRQPINQNYIRIESTSFNGQFLYLNGSQQHLKGIDLVNYNKGKMTATMRRHTKPTNISFLADRRLVILYEEPYFLSVHDLTSRPMVH